MLDNFFLIYVLKLTKIINFEIMVKLSRIKYSYIEIFLNYKLQIEIKLWIVGLLIRLLVL